MSHSIAFVSDAIYPYNKGGKETRLFEVSTRLAAKGYDVHVFCMQWWQGKNKRIEHGVQLHGICPNFPLYDGPRRSIKQGILFGLACFKLLFERFDVVDVDHMPFFPIFSIRIVCWLKRKPMIGTWHEVWGETYWKEYVGSFKGFIASQVERLSILLPDTIIAVSQLTAKRVKKLRKKGKVVIVSNGIDIEKIQSAKPSERHSDIIFAGRLLSHKNVQLLLEAVVYVKKKFPLLKVIIIGEGPEKERLEKQIPLLGLQNHIDFLPFEKDILNLYGLMKSSQIFVLPSSREGFGLVVLEANACGIPVVTVNHPDNAAKNLIHSDNGLVSDITAKDLSAAIVRCLKKDWIAVKENDYDQFSWQHQLVKLEKLYSIH